MAHGHAVCAPGHAAVEVTLGVGDGGGEFSLGVGAGLEDGDATTFHALLVWGQHTPGDALAGEHLEGGLFLPHGQVVHHQVGVFKVGDAQAHESTRRQEGQHQLALGIAAERGEFCLIQHGNGHVERAVHVEPRKPRAGERGGCGADDLYRHGLCNRQHKIALVIAHEETGLPGEGVSIEQGHQLIGPGVFHLDAVRAVFGRSCPDHAGFLREPELRV